jgi:5-hydroxyisourate hydrolase
MAGGISVHAIDVARGLIAEGLVLVAEARIGAHGLLEHPVTAGVGVKAGVHEVLLDIGGFHAATGANAPSFLGIVPFRFTIADVEPHYHLPIKFTPFGYSLYRGA